MKDFNCAIICTLFCLLLCRGDLIKIDNATNTNIQTPASIPFDTIGHEQNETSTTLTDLIDFPSDCSQRQKRKTPYKNKNSRLKKCCPIGESLSVNEANQSGTLCRSATLLLNPNLVNITLYDNCIEDMETDFTLPFEIGNPCNTSILYNDIEDLFFVIQDGSLLVMDIYASDTYALYSTYCIDINNISGITYAIVCLTSVVEHISRGHIVIVAILMLISIPCSLLVSYLHFRIQELRSLHGMILGCMSACLTTGYFLYSVVHICSIDEPNVGYAVQFFVLSYYFWFLSLCCNLAINIWVYIPYNKQRTKCGSMFSFGIYCFISICGAFILVVLTSQKGLQGMPSYFIRGSTESIRESQRYFIPPVSALISLSFIVLASVFFGLQRIKAQGVIVEPNDQAIDNRCFDENIFGEVKKDAKCVSLLAAILLSTWLLEIITFYLPGPQIWLLFMDMINGLQGLLVLLIFLVIRRRRTVIFRWWIDRGSHTIQKIELNLVK